MPLPGRRANAEATWLGAALRADKPRRGASLAASSFMDVGQPSHASKARGLGGLGTQDRRSFCFAATVQPRVRAGSFNGFTDRIEKKGPQFRTNREKALFYGWCEMGRKRTHRCVARNRSGDRRAGEKGKKEKEKNRSPVMLRK